MATAKKTTTPKTAKAAAPAKKPAVKKAEPAPKTVAKKKAEAPAKPAKAPKKAVAKIEAEVAPTVEAPAKKKAAPKKAEAPSSGLPAHVEALLAAIREGRAVELIFSDADANAPRTFEPRQLTFDALAQAWFVFGWDRRYNAERHHRVDLFAEVNEVEGVGRAAQGPYAEGTPGNQIGGWLGGEPIAVKALLHKQWVFAVKQAPAPFPQFQLKEQEDGKALVTFTATDLRAIARWAMQFGDGITVQEPQRLVDRLRQVASAWAGKDLSRPAPVPVAAPAPAPRREEREERPRREEREERPRREEREERPRREEARGSAKVEIRIERL